MKFRSLAALAFGAASLAGCQGSQEADFGKPVVLPPSSDVRPSIRSVAALPGPLPTPPVPPPPHGDTDARLSGEEIGFAEVELPSLLGDLWYPDSQVSLHSQRGRNGANLWPSVTLLAPSDEKIRGVLDYYELRFPGGERKGDEYITAATRPGDDAPARLHVFRAKSGGDAGKILIRLQS